MTPQQTIAHYRITGKIGEGGMGAVYRAVDTKLNRDVAIKVLPDALANDPDYLARFTREAQVLASLSHPNIAILHGVEDRALVMEFVPGPTLEERIQAGPLPLEETLDIARQIAEALEAAHEKGVIHRDLKPANVKVTPEGVVKVLDFGLAKSADPSASTANSPTITMRATQAGVIMGTAAYMAPEQAKGKTADRRVDIWAFGVVLLEMLTGRATYSGDTVAEVLAAVLKDTPDLAALPPGTPPSIQDLLRRCLEKDPRRRLRDIGEARVRIEDSIAGRDASPVRAAAASPRRAVWPYAAMAAAAALVAAGAIWQTRQKPAPQPVVSFEIAPPAGQQFTGAPTVSPDGRRIAIVASEPQPPRRIWLRDLDSSTLKVLPGTDGATNLFWSPDSRSIGFVAGPALKRIDLAGGQVQEIAVLAGTVAGASWNSQGVIILSLFGRNLVRVPASGGAPQTVAISPPEVARMTLRHPVFLPGGRRFLFDAEGDPPREGVYVAGLDSAEPARLVMKPAAQTVFAAGDDLRTGNLFFRDQSALMAIGFDAAREQVVGEPFVVMSNGAGVNRLNISASQPARVVAWRQLAAGATDAELVVLDRSGKRLALVDGGDSGAHPELSPDGSRLLSERGDSAQRLSLWIFDLNRNVASRLSFGPGIQSPAIWLPDGERVLFNGFVDNVQGLYVARADGFGRPELLAKGAFHHLTVTPDGKTAAFESGGVNGGREILFLPLGSGAAPQSLIKSSFSIGNPQFSPDGRWLSYSSMESGKRQVYVESYPPGSGRWQISSGGGSVSRWRRDGREIIYNDEVGHHIYSVTVKAAGSRLELGAPVKLFDGVFLNSYFAITPDAQRFYGNVPPAIAERTADVNPVVVTLNWTSGRFPGSR